MKNWILRIRSNKKNMRNKKYSFNSLFIIYYFLFIILLSVASCSFDYGERDSADKDQPDIVMENVEYMRMRSGDPVARFMAEQAQRFEERRLMELYTFSFEQFEKNGGDVNAFGRAGSAEFMLDSGDVHMDNGVRIEVESEDITIETKQLDWRDQAHTLSGGRDESVLILRANGTSFSGTGFFADARRRTWEFSSEVSGSYIHDDDEDENEDADEDAEDTVELTDNQEPAFTDS